MVTQKEIAEAIGMDTSSVNKILNRRSGSVFRQDTIKKVFRTASDMGYEFERAGKGAFRSVLEALFPRTHGVRALAILRGVPPKEVRRIMKLLYGRDFEPFPNESRDPK